MVATPGAWSSYSYAETASTRHLVHMLAQMVGKLRLALAPKTNHWWHVGLRVTPYGLTTLAMPHGERSLQVDVDLRAHRVVLRTSDLAERVIPLQTTSVAALHERLMDALDALDAPTRIWPVPVEVAQPTPFAEDDEERTYVPAHAVAMADSILRAHRVLSTFRGRFVGKCSPVLFFWGGFDLAVTRFSGRLAPPHPPVPGVPDRVVSEAYSHEVSSAGWWPGSDAHPEPAFFAYSYPEPPGYKGWAIEPRGAGRYHEELGEYVLPESSLHADPRPEESVLRFLQSAYEAGASLAEWNRLALESPSPAATASAARDAHDTLRRAA